MKDHSPTKERASKDSYNIALRELGVVGVRHHPKSRRPFQARLRTGGDDISCGYYADPVSAAIAGNTFAGIYGKPTPHPPEVIEALKAAWARKFRPL